MRRLVLFLILFPVVLVVDLFWLGIVMSGFYSEQLGDLARRHGEALAPRWPAALLVYVLIPAGLVLFVRPTIRASTSFRTVFAWGAAFGFVVYGIYDFSNLAVIEKWTLAMTAADVGWGCLLCGMGAIVIRLADRSPSAAP